MRPHVKIYLAENGYDVGDVILCEIRAGGCRNVSVDICHIEHRGIGGDKSKDRNDNLLAGCRNCHDIIDGADCPFTKDVLKEIARRRICSISE